MTVGTLTSINAAMKDLYPLPGTRIKQWVVDVRREDAWARETCPTVSMLPHNDNTGAECRNTTGANWSDLEHHDCCNECNDVAAAMRLAEPAIVAWLADLAARPPVTFDRSLLSDEIAPDIWRHRL